MNGRMYGRDWHFAYYIDKLKKPCPCCGCGGLALERMPRVYPTREAAEADADVLRKYGESVSIIGVYTEGPQP